MKSYQKSSFSNGNSKCNHFELGVIFNRCQRQKNFNNDYTGWFRSFLTACYRNDFRIFQPFALAVSHNRFFFFFFFGFRWSNANLGNENTWVVVPTSFLFWLFVDLDEKPHTYILIQIQDTNINIGRISGVSVIIFYARNLIDC